MIAWRVARYALQCVDTAKTDFDLWLPLRILSAELFNCFCESVCNLPFPRELGIFELTMSNRVEGFDRRIESG